MKIHENRVSTGKNNSNNRRIERPVEELFTGPNWKQDYIGRNIPDYAQHRKYTKEEKAKVEAFKKHVRRMEYTEEDYRIEEEMFQEFLTWGPLDDFEFEKDFLKHDEWIESDKNMRRIIELQEKWIEEENQ